MLGHPGERLNEYPFSPYNCFEGLVEREPGRYYLSHNGQDVPMVFTITGRHRETGPIDRVRS